MKQSASHIIMIRPASFGFNTETARTNHFQNEKQSDAQKKALTEFDEMVKQLKKSRVNLTVIQDEPYPIKPDAIFPNNWFSTHHNGKAVLYPMMAKNRRLERRLDILEVLRKHHLINQIIDLREYETNGQFLEGTGSIVFDHINKIAFACRSPRTNEAVLHELCTELNYQPVYFDALDNNGSAIYHTNVLMAIGTDWAACCAEAIPQNQRVDVMNLLRNKRELITISLPQMAAFAGNMLELQNTDGEKLIVVSQTAYHQFSEQQLKALEKHAHLLPIYIPTIEKVGGGSVRCMMAENFALDRLL